MVFNFVFYQNIIQVLLTPTLAGGLCEDQSPKFRIIAESFSVQQMKFYKVIQGHALGKNSENGQNMVN